MNNAKVDLCCDFWILLFWVSYQILSIIKIAVGDTQEKKMFICFYTQNQNQGQTQTLKMFAQKKNNLICMTPNNLCE
jgi:hypothetical protein